MEVIKGTVEHAGAVAEFWNAKAQDPQSWWYGSPTKTADQIAGLLSQGYSLVVALDLGVLMGFGLWLGPRLLGFTALNREAFYRMMRVWAQENPGQRGISVIPARDTTEKGWTDALGVADVQPLGHKPLKAGEDRATRKVWTYRAEADLNSLLAAIDGKLAEATR
jgi:hypothetical protein